jgi:hypothetical protein
MLSVRVVVVSVVVVVVVGLVSAQLFRVKLAATANAQARRLKIFIPAFSDLG